MQKQWGRDKLGWVQKKEMTGNQIVEAFLPGLHAFSWGASKNTDALARAQRFWGNQSEVLAQARRILNEMTAAVQGRTVAAWTRAMVVERQHLSFSPAPSTLPTCGPWEAYTSLAWINQRQDAPLQIAWEGLSTRETYQSWWVSHWSPYIAQGRVVGWHNLFLRNHHLTISNLWQPNLIISMWVKLSVLGHSGVCHSSRWEMASLSSCYSTSWDRVFIGVVQRNGNHDKAIHRFISRHWFMWLIWWC